MTRADAGTRAKRAVRRPRPGAVIDAKLPLIPGAACRGHPQQLWDDQARPKEPPSIRDLRHQAAAEICGRCPARQACDEAASDLLRQAVPITGIWAGTLRELVCGHCKQQFDQRRPGQRYCCHDCKISAQTLRQTIARKALRERRPEPPKGTRGEEGPPGKSSTRGSTTSVKTKKWTQNQ